MRDIIEKLEHGIMVCTATNTDLVHIDKKDAVRIVDVLKKHEPPSERMRMGSIKPNNTDIEYVCARCGSSTHVDWRDVTMCDVPSGLKGKFHCPICGYRVSVDLKPLPKKVVTT